MRTSNRVGFVMAFWMLWLACATSSLAQQGQLGASQFIPPEMIIEHRVEIGLRDEQHRKIGKISGEFGRKIQSLQRQVNKQNVILRGLLDAHPIDEATTLNQVRSFLSAEQNAKQAQMEAMIRIRNVLTNKQRAFLLSKIKSMGPQALQTGLGPGKSKNKQQGQRFTHPPVAVTRLAKSSPLLSFADVKKSVRDLFVEDVAWRKIDWETCLLKALSRSRDERKPLVLWVFIDRPIDDERC